MDNIRKFLMQTPPWSVNDSLVVAIDYPNSVAFNSTGSGSPASAVNNALEEIAAAMDSAHVVSGRVDIVAHSMGGLVARFYTSFPEYRSLRDRGQGRFHEAVSLDTPELGSKLASYLIAQRNIPFNPKTDKISATIWGIAGCSPVDTVELCFNKLELAPPGQNITAGGVWSLIPGGASSLTPFPTTIPDLVWRSVSGLRPQGKTVLTGESTLQVELERLIDAIYPAGKAPTVTQILGDNAQDDVIVTLKSQLATGPAAAGSGQYATLTNMSHNPAPKPLSISGWSLNDDNAQNDARVDNITACWLETDGAASCAKNFEPASTVARTAAEGRQTAIDDIVIAASHSEPRVVDRLSLQGMASPVLGRAQRVTLRLTNAALLTDLSIVQTDGLGHRVVTHPALSLLGPNQAVATVVPLLPGNVRFTFGATFADNGVSVQHLDALVGVSPAAPLRFYGDVNSAAISPVHHLTISLDPRLGGYVLAPRAIYAAAPDQAVDVSRWVSYRVSQGNGLPVIQIHPNGEIVGLRPGRASVEVRFGSVVDDIGVVVKPQGQ